MKLPIRLFVVGLVALVGAALAPAAWAEADVRVLHAAPDVPAVTVYVNGSVAVERLEPLAATDYLSLPAGTYRVAVSAAGKAESEALLRTELAVEDDKRYTAFATGLLASHATNSVRLGVIEDLGRAPFELTALRVWHNSPDAPAVDVLVNGQKVLSNVPFGTASEYLEVPAGMYDVEVNVAGTSTSVFSGMVELERGQSYTAVALGSVTQLGEPFTVSVLEDATSGAALRVLHAIPNVAAVTVYVDGEVAVQRVNRLKWTGYLSLDPGTYEVAVAPFGEPVSEAVLTKSITIADQARYTATARGLAGSKKLELTLRPSIAAAPAGKAAVRVTHLSPDAPRVDVFVNGQKTLSNVRYRQASAFLTLDPGTYAIQVRVAGTNTTVLSKSVTVEADRAYNLVALGSATGKGGKGAGLRLAVLPVVR